MKCMGLSLLVLSLSLSGCVDRVSKDDKKGDDVAVPSDAVAPSDAGVSEDGTTEGDTPAPSDTSAPSDAVADATTVEDAAVEEDVTEPEEDAAVEEDVTEPSDIPEIISGCNADEGVALMGVNPGVLMEKCVAQCGVGELMCVVGCFAEGAKVSVECGACFGDAYACILEKCNDVCDSLTDDACEKCASNMGCFDDLGTCTGAP
jgi:hypothetical protein